MALTAVGHEHLRAGHHVGVVPAECDGADGLDVRAGVRLRETQAAALVTARESRQKAAALLLRAVIQHDQRHHRVAVDDARERHPPAAQLFDDSRVHADGQAEAAIRPGDEAAEESELAHARDQPVRVLVRVLERERDRIHLFVDERSNRVDEGIAHGRDGTPRVK